MSRKRAECLEVVSLIEGFNVSVNGLIVDGRPDFEAWARAAQALRVMERGLPFAIGDFVIQAEAQLGEAASQLIDATEWKRETVEVYHWVAQKVAPPDRRMDRLGVAHHMAVAKLPQPRQRHWLAKAANDAGNEPWSVRRLQLAIRAGEDVPVSGYYVVVRCDSEQQQAELVTRLEREGLVCRTRESRRGKVA